MKFDLQAFDKSLRSLEVKYKDLVEDSIVARKKAEKIEDLSK